MSNPRAVVARRKEVMSLLSKCVSEEDIAKQLGVDQSTISRDIKALKISAQKYVYDLAKSDLAYSYKQSIDGLHEVSKEAWKIYNDSINMKTKLQALKVLKECGEATFNLYNQGPFLMNIKALEERVNRIESGGQKQEQTRRQTI